MSKILITGANGFIGSFFVQEAIRQGHQVYAAVRNTSKLSYLENYNVNILILDLSSIDSLIKTWNKLKKEHLSFDYVIHNAGVTQVDKLGDFDLVNNIFTQNLYNSFLKSDFIPKKFIFISSLAALGPGDATSMSPINMHSKANPITNYGKSKLKAELFIRKENKIPFLIFRPTAVYGPREKDLFTLFKILNRHIEAYISSPKQLLSFIHVEDLSKLIIKACESEVNNKSFIVSDGKTYTCAQLNLIVRNALGKWTIRIVIPKLFVKIIMNTCGLIAKLNHKSSLLNKDKYKELTSINWSCDSSNTFEVFQMKPKYKLLNGIAQTIKWYKTNNCL